MNTAIEKLKLVAELESLTLEYSRLRDALTDSISELDREIEVIRKTRMADIRMKARLLRTRHDRLKTWIEDHKDLFVKPRTITIGGIKVGLVDAKPKLKWADEATLIKQLRRILKDESDAYIKTEESPIASALKRLPEETLTKLGITVHAAKDQVVILSTDSEIEKLVSAMLATSEEEAA